MARDDLSRKTVEIFELSEFDLESILANSKKIKEIPSEELVNNVRNFVNNLNSEQYEAFIELSFYLTKLPKELYKLAGVKNRYAGGFAPDEAVLMTGNYLANKKPESGRKI